MMTRTKMISHAALLIVVAAATLPASAQTTDKGSCSVRVADAGMTSMYPVDLPQLASIQGLSGSAIVRVELDERGIAHRAVIATSSGYTILDDAARKAALAQKYTPQIRDCESVAGSYRVIVDFARGEG